MLQRRYWIALGAVAAIVTAALTPTAVAQAAIVGPPSGAIVVGVAGPNCTAPAFATINGAIAGAAAGSTLYICAGVYHESVVVNKNLTLLGAQHGVTAITGRTDQTQESVVIAPASADIEYDAPATTGTIDGLTLEGNGLNAVTNDGNNNDGIRAASDTSNVSQGFTWVNNVIENTTTGIDFNATGVIATTISANRIQNNVEPGGNQGMNGIFFTNGPANNVTITGNLFGHEDVDINTTGVGPGNGVIRSTGLSITHNVSIDTNNILALFKTDHATISDNTSGWTTNECATLTDPSYYIDGGNISPTISDNIIDCGQGTGVRDGTGIFLSNASYRSAGEFLPDTGVIISGNTITNRGNGIEVGPLGQLDPTSVISDNTITNPTGNGIWVHAPSAPAVGTPAPVYGGTIENNVATGAAVTDCRDNTVGSGTLGTANTWTTNTGDTSEPIGLCGLPVGPAITSPNPPNTIGASAETGCAGASYSFPFTASGTTPITFAVTDGALPEGLSLDPSTGLLSGFATAVGTATFTVTATNPFGTDTQRDTIVVSACAVVHLPIVSG
jgi:hypothetical protein